MEESEQRQISLTRKLVPNIIALVLIAIGLWLAITMLVALKASLAAPSGAQDSSGTAAEQIAGGFLAGMAIGVGIAFNFILFGGIAIGSIIGLVFNLRSTKNKVFFGASLTFSILYGLTLLACIAGIAISCVPAK